jgi:hypothetical protein
MNSSVDALRAIEDMLHDIGASAPATAASPLAQQHSYGKHSPTNNRSVVKDCLAVESRNQFAIPKFTKRAASETPTLLRGAHMAGKDNTRKRYFGKGFQPPPAESPGPIYQPLGFVDERTLGKSFPKAERMRASTADLSPAPKMQVMPPSVGRQTESRMSNAPSVAFTQAKRFNPKEMISRAHCKGAPSQDAPAPTAYQPDILSLTDKGHGVSFSGSRSVPTNKIFISRAHVADCIGAASPGPIYNPGEVQVERTHAPFAILQSKHRSAPSFTFGISDRPSDREVIVEEPEVLPADATCPIDLSSGKPRRKCLNAAGKAGSSVRHTPMQRFISHEHSKVQCTTETPGPAYYSPSIEPTKKEVVGVSFPKEKKNSTARFFSKELSLAKGKDSPGMRYTPNPDVVRPNLKSATFGPPADSQVTTSDRFTDKVFLGKGMGEHYGQASPGPAYSQELPKFMKQSTPAWTIVHKEKHFEHVYPAPSRPRWVSSESAKENMGAFSPGPKYDTTTKVFGGDAPSYTFGITDREFGPQFTEEQRAKFGTAEKPYTCPGEARFISIIHSRTARAGKSSPGPQNPNVNPNDAICSTVRHAPEVRIAPPPSNHSRLKNEDTGTTSPVLLLEPKDDVTRPVRLSHGFEKAEKMPQGKLTAGPGPTAYHPKWELQEPRVKGASFGGLG